MVDFTLHDIDLSIVNGIRRTILAYIPNVAADVNTVDLKHINHHMTLEMLKHKLSLIPLCFSEDEIEKFNPTKYRFVLNVKNEGITKIPVTTNDIQIINPENGQSYPASFHKKIFPSNKITKHHILITFLTPNVSNTKHGEAIHLEFSAKKDIAYNNACFSPVSKCAFHYAINEQEALKYRELSSNPKQFDVHDKYRIYKKNEKGDPTEFIFSIESECNLSEEYLFNKAVFIIKQKLRSLEYDVMDIDDQYFGVHITGENHTIGNIISSLIFNKMKSPLIFVGSYMPHPLNNEVVVKVGFEKNMSLQEVTKWFQSELNSIIDVDLNISFPK